MLYNQINRKTEIVSTIISCLSLLLIFWITKDIKMNLTNKMISATILVVLLLLGILKQKFRHLLILFFIALIGFGYKFYFNY